MSEEEKIENQNAESQTPDVESLFTNNAGFEEESTKERQQSVERNITVEQPSTIIHEPSTIMEVQKHPHHVTHKKKWGEYLLEFFYAFSCSVSRLCSREY
ncbi:MAG: hypothetical protein ABJA37_13220 [Ferruginibacter sp.]